MDIPNGRDFDELLLSFQRHFLYRGVDKGVFIWDGGNVQCSIGFHGSPYCVTPLALINDL